LRKWPWLVRNSTVMVPRPSGVDRGGRGNCYIRNGQAVLIGNQQTVRKGEGLNEHAGILIPTWPVAVHNCLLTQRCHRPVVICILAAIASATSCWLKLLLPKHIQLHHTCSQMLIMDMFSEPASSWARCQMYDDGHELAVADILERMPHLLVKVFVCAHCVAHHQCIPINLHLVVLLGLHITHLPCIPHGTSHW
jgi:hypothetical protein